MKLDYITVLHQGIAELVKRFQQNPFDFLYERDLHPVLFTILQEGFGQERVTMKGRYWSTKEYGTTDSIETLP